MRTMADVLRMVSLNDLAHRIRIPKEELIQIATNRNSYYRSFSRKKKGGGSRAIKTATGKLKIAQKRIHRHLLDDIEYEPWLHGCIKNKSTITNAEIHRGKEAVIKIDIESFYPTIDEDRVESI